MRLAKWVVALGCWAAVWSVSPVVIAQEPPKYDDLKKMYDDALAKMKSSQDAKNALAAEKDALAKQLEDVRKQLDAVTKERDELQRESTTYAEKTFNLRSYHAAWQEFLRKYPPLQAKWKVFLDAELLRAGNELPTLVEPEWPFRIDG
jgi:predicted nuclease with TOPRIM domain